MKSPLRWLGGKGKLAPWLMKQLPRHQRYCEPFFGGGSLFFAKAPAEIETVNDLDGNVSLFFQVLRHPHLGERLIELAENTPLGRREFEACRDWFRNPHPASEELEVAWRFFVWNAQSYAGGMEAWSFSIGLARQQGGLSAACDVWRNCLARLRPARERLLRTQIENAPALEVLARYDSFETCHYLDPPYVPDTRVRGRYRTDMTTRDHRELVAALPDLKGMVLLSGYRSALYVPLEAAGWRRLEYPVLCHASPLPTKPKRTECLWINPAAQVHRFGLFSEEAT